MILSLGVVGFVGAPYLEVAAVDVVVGFFIGVAVGVVDNVVAIIVVDIVAVGVVDYVVAIVGVDIVAV